MSSEQEAQDLSRVGSCSSFLFKNALYFTLRWEGFTGRLLLVLFGNFDLQLEVDEQSSLL